MIALRLTAPAPPERQDGYRQRDRDDDYPDDDDHHQRPLPEDRIQRMDEPLQQLRVCGFRVMCAYAQAALFLLRFGQPHGHVAR